MNKVRASMVLTMLLGAALVNFGGCTADEPPPDNPSGSSGSGSSSGAATSCGDGKLDMGEDCDDGNNSGNDGCTACVVDACYTCTAEAGALSTCTFAASGATCEETKVCDGAGACVECVDDTTCNGGFCHQNACFKCDDGMKNGDETDVDCGGAKCTTKCGIGKMCGAGADCDTTFCADGVCCDDVCDGACNSCALAGSLGSCSTIAKYGEDPNYGTGESCTVAEGEACTGGAACAKANGQTCMSNAQCASNKCVDPAGGNNKVCLKNTGDACTVNEECFNLMCDMTTMKCL